MKSNAFTVGGLSRIWLRASFLACNFVARDLHFGFELLHQTFFRQLCNHNYGRRQKKFGAIVFAQNPDLEGQSCIFSVTVSILNMGRSMYSGPAHLRM